MYVCLCKAITESQISAAVDEGADSLVKLRKKIGVADNFAEIKLSQKAGRVAADERGE